MEVNEVVCLLLKEALFGETEGSYKVSDINIRNNEKMVVSETQALFWSKVYNEIQNQAIAGITAPIVSQHTEIPEPIRSAWSGLQRSYAIRYVRMAEEQRRTCELLQSNRIKVAVMKGMAAAIYYPVPEYRAMGDVDLLVKPEDYEKAVSVLKNNGYNLIEKNIDQFHTPFRKYNILYELHNSPAVTNKAATAAKIRNYILSGMDLIEMNELGQDKFPILPWKQNGMELIWHIRQHLYSGLGLRQILDWMMFANNYLDDRRMKEYMPDLKMCGMDHLAIVVTKMCQMYLGLSCENITWCEGAEEDLCEELLHFIMEQGDFGIKTQEQKTAKVVAGYSNPLVLLTKLQQMGRSKWKLLQKVPILKPFAFIYGGLMAINLASEQKGGKKELLDNILLGRKRKRFLDRLYSHSKDNSVIRSQR